MTFPFRDLIREIFPFREWTCPLCHSIPLQCLSSRKRSRTFPARISVSSPLYGQYRNCFPANLPALPSPQSAAFSHCGLLSECRGIQNRLCTAAAALLPLISDIFPIDGIHSRTAYRLLSAKKDSSGRNTNRILSLSAEQMVLNSDFSHKIRTAPYCRASIRRNRILHSDNKKAVPKHCFLCAFQPAISQR